MSYTIQEILKLVAFRIEILRSRGFLMIEIEKDIEAYLKAMENPTVEVAGFIEKQFDYIRWTKGL